MAKEWYYKVGGIKDGPVSSSTIRSMLRDGRLKVDDQISDATTPRKWKAISRFPSLRELARNDVAVGSTADSTAEQSEAETPLTGRHKINPNDTYAGRLAKEKRFRVRVNGALLLGATIATGWLLSAWAGMWSGAEGSRFAWFLAGFIIAGLVTLPRFFVKNLDDLVADAELFKQNFKSASSLIGLVLAAGCLVFGLIWMASQPGVQRHASRVWNRESLLELALTHQQRIKANRPEGTSNAQIPTEKMLIVYEAPGSGNLHLHSYNMHSPSELKATHPDHVKLIVYLQPDGVVRSAEPVYKLVKANGRVLRTFHQSNWVYVISIYDISKDRIIYRHSGHGDSAPGDSQARQFPDSSYGWSFEMDPWPWQHLKSILPR